MYGAYDAACMTKSPFYMEPPFYPFPGVRPKTMVNSLQWMTGRRQITQEPHSTAHPRNGVKMGTTPFDDNCLPTSEGGVSSWGFCWSTHMEISTSHPNPAVKHHQLYSVQYLVSHRDQSLRTQEDEPSQ